MKHDHSYEGRLTHALGARCDHVVCVSHAMATAFADLPEERVSVIYPGVILRDLKPVEGTTPTIVSVGRMDPFKGFDQLLHAAAQLRAEGVERRRPPRRPAGQRPHQDTQLELKRLADELGIGRRQGRLGRRPRRGLRVRPRRRAREQAQGRERRARRGRAARPDGGDGRRAARRRHRHAGHRRGDRGLRIARRPARPPRTSPRRSSPTCRTPRWRHEREPRAARASSS